MKTTFELWLSRVDTVLTNTVELTHEDLADQNWYDWWSGGMSATAAAKMALAEEGYQED